MHLPIISAQPWLRTGLRIQSWDSLFQPGNRFLPWPPHLARGSDHHHHFLEVELISGQIVNVDLIFNLAPGLPGIIEHLPEVGSPGLQQDELGWESFQEHSQQTICKGHHSESRKENTPIPPQSWNCAVKRCHAQTWAASPSAVSYSCHFCHRLWHLPTFPTPHSLQNVPWSTESKPSCRGFCVPSHCAHLQLPHLYRNSSEQLKVLNSAQSGLVFKFLKWPKHQISILFQPLRRASRGEQWHQKLWQEQSTLHAGWGYLGWLHPGQQGKTKQSKKKKAIGNESSRKSHRKHSGDMTKIPPTAADWFF